MIDVLKELEREIEKYRKELEEYGCGDSFPGSLRKERKTMCGMVLGWIEKLKGKAQDEIDKAVNEALDKVEADVRKSNLCGKDLLYGSLERARPKAKKEEEKLLGMDVVVDPTLSEGVIELRHNGKLLGKIVNVGKEATCRQGQEQVLLDMEQACFEGTAINLMWLKEYREVGGLEKEEKHPEPKFKVGQRIRIIGREIAGVVTDRAWRGSYWCYRMKRDADWSEMWWAEKEATAVEEPTTQKVTDEWEIGAGELCGPCKRLRGFECSEFRQVLACHSSIGGGKSTWRRCKECLEKWGKKG